MIYEQPQRPSYVTYTQRRQAELNRGIAGSGKFKEKFQLKGRKNEEYYVIAIDTFSEIQFDTLSLPNKLQYTPVARLMKI